VQQKNELSVRPEVRILGGAVWFLAVGRLGCTQAGSSGRVARILRIEANFFYVVMICYGYAGPVRLDWDGF